MQLEEFLKQKQMFPNNAWVKKCGFNSLYLRKGKLFLKIKQGFFWCDPCLTIANVTVLKRGQGTFTQLVSELCSREFAIYVENAHSNRFQRKLLSLGFEEANSDDGPNFIINHHDKLEKLVTAW